MKTMTMKEMKRAYQQLMKKERLQLIQVNKYDSLISNLLLEPERFGRQIDLSSTKTSFMQIQKVKNKLEEKLTSIRFEMSLLSAKMNNKTECVRDNKSVEELFSSLNAKYANCSIPVEFEYEYDSEVGDLKSVIFYRINPKDKE